MTVMLICGYSNWVTKAKCSSLADYTSNFKNLTIFSLTRDRETLRLCSHFGHNWSTVRSPSTSSRRGARTRNWAPCVRMFSIKFSAIYFAANLKLPATLMFQSENRQREISNKNVHGYISSTVCVNTIQFCGNSLLKIPCAGVAHAMPVITVSR